MSTSKPRKGDKKKDKSGRKARKTEAPLRLMPPESLVAKAFDGTDLSFSDGLLETCRTQWEYGEWNALAALEEAQIAGSRDRAKLALLSAAGRSHAEDPAGAAHFLRLAAKWGCDPQLIRQVMISAVHNSLGRAATCLDEEDTAQGHFETSIGLVEPRAATGLLARTRQVRETARMGLLPDAAKLLQLDFALAKTAPADHEARLMMVKVEMDLLKQEIALAVNRRQIFPDEKPAATTTSIEELERKSVSQLGQDIWVLQQTGFQRGGFFVEFGATNGVLLSNTLLLEREFGWTGLCAEPNPKFYADLKANRRCTTTTDCIGGVSGQPVRFILADVFGSMQQHANDDLHGAARAAYLSQGAYVDLTTISLHDYLTQHGAPKVIDYMSIDTEGSEYEILRTFPFDKWTVRFLTIEHNFTPMREQIRALLEPLGYVRTEANWDDWYALKQ